MRMVAVAIEMRRVMTGCRAACLPYCVKALRRGCFRSSAGGSVVLRNNQQENLNSEIKSKRTLETDREDTRSLKLESLRPCPTRQGKQSLLQVLRNVSELSSSPQHCLARSRSESGLIGISSNIEKMLDVN